MLNLKKGKAMSHTHLPPVVDAGGNHWQEERPALMHGRMGHPEDKQAGSSLVVLSYRNGRVGGKASVYVNAASGPFQLQFNLTACEAEELAGQLQRAASRARSMNTRPGRRAA